MAKAQLATEEMGRKRLCPSCAGRFYDLGKSPAECPYCETVFNPDEAAKGRRKPAAAAETKPAAKKAPAKKKAEAEEDDDLPEVDDLDDVSDDDDEDDEMLEDASDLGEDDEDVAEVIEKVDRKEDD